MPQTYQTIEEAEAAAEDKANNIRHNNHAYVYKLREGGFGVHFHPEDRYVSTFLPTGAKIVLHAEKSYGAIGSGQDIVWTWEPRGNISPSERDVLRDALGNAKAQALLDVLGDEEE